MEVEVRLPQLEELNTKLTTVIGLLENIDTIVSLTAANVEEVVAKTFLALDKKVDALALAIAAPGPVQMALPLTDKAESADQPAIDQPAIDKSAPAPKKARRKVQLVGVEYSGVVTEPAAAKSNGNGEAHDDHAPDDEDTQRARAAFEAKRIARTHGIGAVRAIVKKVAGANIIQIDDVPVRRLSALLTELQAM